MTDRVAKWADADLPPLAYALKRGVALAAFAAVFLSASGAFDTESAPPLSRLAYWVAISVVAIAALESAHLGLRAWLPQAPESRLRLIGLSMLVLPATGLALLLCKLVFGGYPKLVDYVTLLPGTAGILVSLQLVLGHSAKPVQPAPKPADTGVLVDALPLPLRGARIDALQAEDHYVRIYTSAGDALVRMRLRDAIMAVGPGLRPHRSWWVAQHSVTGLRRRRGGTAVLTILGGRRVPVSRALARELGPEFGEDGPHAG